MSQEPCGKSTPATPTTPNSGTEFSSVNTYLPHKSRSEKDLHFGILSPLDELPRRPIRKTSISEEPTEAETKNIRNLKAVEVIKFI